MTSRRCRSSATFTSRPAWLGQPLLADPRVSCACLFSGRVLREGARGGRTHAQTAAETSAAEAGLLRVPMGGPSLADLQRGHKARLLDARARAARQTAPTSKSGTRGGDKHYVTTRKAPLQRWLLAQLLASVATEGRSIEQICHGGGGPAGDSS